MSRLRDREDQATVELTVIFTDAETDLAYKVILDRKGLSFLTAEQLWEFSEKCRVPKIMAFGKHKGLSIAQLPRDYKMWCLRQPDMDIYVQKAIKESL